MGKTYGLPATNVGRPNKHFSLSWFLYCGNFMKLENVAIANALQLEVARRHASPFPL